MSVAKSIALPVLLAALAIFGAQLAQAREVVLYNHRWERVQVGVIIAENTTVGQLKDVVSQRLDIPLDRLRLAGNSNNPLLDDDKFVANYYDFADIVVVKLCDDLKKAGPIHVELDNKRIQLVVSKNKKLSWLKKEALGEAVKEGYKVYFEGVELQDDSKNLSDYKFYKGAYVVMLKKDETFKVKVHPLVGSPTEFNVKQDTSVNDLRKIIGDAGIDIQDRLLVHRNTTMDGNRKLSTFSKVFHQGLTVKIVGRIDDKGAKVVVYYDKPGKVQHFEIFVNSENTVIELKNFALNIEKTVPVERMELRYQGQVMSEDGRKLQDYDVYPGAWILIRRKPHD